MQRPQSDRRESREIVRQAFLANRDGERRHAFEAMLARGRAEERQRMFRIARKPEQGTHERTVVVEDFELTPKGDPSRAASDLCEVASAATRRACSREIRS